jgi:ribosomal protein L29
MPKKKDTALAELRRMRPEDLRRDIRKSEEAIMKMRLGIKIGKEKDTARYRRSRRQLARMLTVLRELAQPSDSPVSSSTS